MVHWLRRRYGVCLLILVYCVLAAGAQVLIWNSVVGVRDLRFIRVIDVARQAEMLFREAHNLADGVEAAATGEAPGDMRRRRAGVLLRLNAVSVSVNDLQRHGLLPPMVGERLKGLADAVAAVPRDLQPLSPGESAALAVRLRAAAEYFGGDVQRELHETMATQTVALRDYSTWVGVLSSVVAVAGLAVLLLVILLHRKNIELRRQAAEDSLTGLSNRRTAMEQGQALLSATRRAGRAGTVAVLDLDHFKEINDTYGHLAGDVVIQQAATVMAARIRNGDLLARVGGEEFMLILPNTGEDGARAVCQQLLAALRCMTVQYRGESIAITASAGCATGRGSDLSMETLYRLADQAMYDAKSSGRNQLSACPLYCALSGRDAAVSI